MGYSSQASIEAAIGVAQLAQLAGAGTATTIPGLVTAAIAEADAIIDSYAQKRYQVPFGAPVPPTISSLSARMALRFLRRDRTMVLAADVTADVTDRKWLEALATGMVTVGVAPLPTRSELEVAKAGERSTTKNVSRNRLKGYW